VRFDEEAGALYNDKSRGTEYIQNDDIAADGVEVRLSFGLGPSDIGDSVDFMPNDASGRRVRTFWSGREAMGETQFVLESAKVQVKQITIRAVAGSTKGTSTTVVGDQILSIHNAGESTTSMDHECKVGDATPADCVAVVRRNGGEEGGREAGRQGGRAARREGRGER
jgi:hypothetical protein